MSITMAMNYLLVTLALVSMVMAGVDYSGYQVIQFVPETEQHLQMLRALPLHAVDFWHGVTTVKEPVDVMIAGQDMGLLSDLSDAGLSHHVLINDVGRLVEESRLEMSYQSSLESRGSVNDQFYTLAEIDALLDGWVATCGSDCQLITIGSSYEGRDLKIIKISRPGTDRRAIWLDGGIHAREWLSPAVMVCYIDKLVNDYGVDPEVTQLRDLYDFYIHPVVNPDGYEYTWTMDRMWRKTRSPNAGSSCMGTDGNRNYDYMWELGSTTTCAENYRGDTAESEVEIAAFTDYVLQISGSIDLLISHHTYGQILLMPWGYTSEDPEDIDDLIRLAEIGVNAVNANSDVIYTYGKTSGSGSGMSLDWAKGAAGIKYSYLMEMRDTGIYGFVPPPTEILPTCVENWAGLAAMALDLATPPAQ